MTADYADFSSERNDLHCRWPTNADDSRLLMPWRRIAIVGDSIAAGIRGPADGYRDVDGIQRVVDHLRGEHWALRYVNLGVPGLTLKQIGATQLQPALAFEPDLVIVGAGGNDALSREFDAEHVRRKLASLCTPLVSRGADLVTIGLFDLPRSGLIPEPHASALANRFDVLDDLTEHTAIDLGGEHTWNHRHPLAADPSIFASDNLHANGRGHAVASVTLISALIRLQSCSAAGSA